MQKPDRGRRWNAWVIVLAGATMLGMATASEAEVGWFVGAGAGQSKLNGFRLPTTTFDRTDRAPMIFGGYQFHTYFATAAGYLDLGEFHATGPSFGGYAQDLRVKGFLLSGIGILPVGSRLAMVGTVGTYRWSVDFHGSDPFDPDRNSSDTGLSPVFGAGVNYDVHRENHTMLHILWQRYSKVGNRQTVEHENDYDLFMAGATYHFAP